MCIRDRARPATRCPPPSPRAAAAPLLPSASPPDPGRRADVQRWSRCSSSTAPLVLSPGSGPPKSTRAIPSSTAAPVPWRGTARSASTVISPCASMHSTAAKVPVGCSPPTGTFAAVECIDAQGEITVLADLAVPRHGTGAAVLDGMALVLLGGPEPGLSTSGAVELLHLDHR